MVNRQVVGAHYGLRDWLVQRVTAVIMLVYAIGIVAFLLLASGASYEAWQQLFACTWVKVLTTVTVVALLWHAWVGIRDIWMDYVQPVGIRLTLHVLTILWLVASFIYSIHVVWGA
ncbi:succinate dehydrogenase, hydrophobic membrane anchor protein [Chitiniphilus shinanonensis]|uniref:Succinate dehydrogenase hydrophobic membrane anchor subunit n=1 Tax=Chitiniphilus shinanonensis TaxID=553088 RepID=A0ABQ6BPT5_9NEIS|nr:succinate dehydrogenase, hydrophobic membrane anchor protein [Chitiniphilus shinanonensis]GLS03287.1 succinate dehydrogenase, hydrophobic membrane anchor protein [Chitiniphilus shinanonensis]